MSPQNLREISAGPLLGTSPSPLPETLTRSRRLWGYGFAAIGTVLFALKAIMVKLAYSPFGGLAENELDVVTLLMLRMGFSVPVYLGIGFWVLRRRKQNGLDAPRPLFFLKAAGVGCISYYMCSFLDFQGLKLITAQLERLLLFTYPAFVLILGALFFGGRLTVKGICAIIVSYCGIGIIFLGGDIATGEAVALGSALVVLCAFLFGLSQLLSKPLINKMGSLLYTCAAMVAASAAVTLHFLTHNAMSVARITEALTLPLPIFVLAGLIAVFSTLIPSFLVNLAIGRVGAQVVAVIGMLSPIASIVAAIILLDEPFGWVDAAGTCLTILGIGVYTWLDRQDTLKRSVKES